ncbi:MAG: hypothetical protein IPM82_22795 [Saprospiraceae bacterium]|nr:hypothetical protein [Saprospiraceae bacterium]
MRKLHEFGTEKIIWIFTKKTIIVATPGILGHFDLKTMWKSWGISQWANTSKEGIEGEDFTHRGEKKVGMPPHPPLTSPASHPPCTTASSHQ